MAFCFVGLVKLAALFNAKAKLFVDGRAGLFQRLTIAFQNNTHRIIWFHCASLGEFEQGRPVMEELRKQLPEYKVLLTFFSPSGYEVRKNYPGADYIFYLPYDLPSHCRKFILITRPVIAIFIKYEFWPNLFREMGLQRIPVLSVSSIFRGDQMYFKIYGGRARRILKTVNHFFVQNRQSVDLLKNIEIHNVTLSGDTRFDRVYSITQGRQENIIAKQFKDGQTCWVIGSCWPEDFEIFAHFINADRGKSKFIIAPHEIRKDFIEDILKSLEVKAVCYSQSDARFEDYNVLIIDNIGMLSVLYRYGEYAYVGGGLGRGLHNILEAACYGVPVFFGNKNYERFQEAVDLIAHGGGFAVRDFAELKSEYENLASDPDNYVVACNASKNYVEMNLGATQKVVSYCLTLLKEHEGKSL
jgi:3-deoxy-D-manno-octulosonic-acid transferase